MSWNKLNLGPGHLPDLPSDALLRIVSELFDPDEFDRKGLSRDDALADLNKLLSREGLAAYFDASGRCFVRNTGTGNKCSPRFSLHFRRRLCPAQFPRTSPPKT